MDAFTTCLWFDTQGEEAARFYAGIFPDSSVGKVTPYPAGERAGQTMTVDFVLNGSKFVALNGGPEFTFSPAISFVVHCEKQKEVDRYWDKLLKAGATPTACGWIKDPFGLSWQIVPRRFTELIRDRDPRKVKAVMEAMMTMVKLDVAELERAFNEA